MTRVLAGSVETRVVVEAGCMLTKVVVTGAIVDVINWTVVAVR